MNDVLKIRLPETLSMPPAKGPGSSKHSWVAYGQRVTEVNDHLWTEVTDLRRRMHELELENWRLRGQIDQPHLSGPV